MLVDWIASRDGSPPERPKSLVAETPRTSVTHEPLCLHRRHGCGRISAAVPASRRSRWVRCFRPDIADACQGIDRGSALAAGCGSNPRPGGPSSAIYQLFADDASLQKAFTAVLNGWTGPRRRVPAKDRSCRLRESDGSTYGSVAVAGTPPSGTAPWFDEGRRPVPPASRGGYQGQSYPADLFAWVRAQAVSRLVLYWRTTTSAIVTVIRWTSAGGDDAYREDHVRPLADGMTTVPLSPGQPNFWGYSVLQDSDGRSGLAPNSGPIGCDAVPADAPRVPTRPMPAAPPLRSTRWSRTPTFTKDVPVPPCRPATADAGATCGRTSRARFTAGRRATMVSSCQPITAFSGNRQRAHAKLSTLVSTCRGLRLSTSVTTKAVSSEAWQDDEAAAVGPFLRHGDVSHDRAGSGDPESRTWITFDPS